MNNRQQIGDNVIIIYQNITFTTKIINIEGLKLILEDQNKNVSSLTWNGNKWLLADLTEPSSILFQINDKLFFYSKSADKIAGKGVNESVSNLNNYTELNKIPDWRKMLSNFWISPFNLKGIMWNTVEHTFQAYKLNIVDGNVAFLLSLNSDSKESKCDGEIARSWRKKVFLNEEQLKQWNKMKDDVMFEALYAKFSSNPELKKVLLLTGNAELYHGTRGVPTTRQYILERIRDKLK
jgi:ribA/ribD-fused uncharacterized protein